MKPRMNVYLTTAKRVLPYAWPMIHSLFEQNQESEIYLYLVSENLEEKDIREEQKLAERYGNHIVILHFDEEMARGKIVSVSEHWPLGTLGCYWLFHELLPPEVDRILALESDAVVTGSLREFYDTKLNGYYAACPDAEHKPLSHRKLMEKLKGDVLTFVVSVYDVEAIRRDFTLEKILETDRFVVKEFGHSQQELTFGILFKDKIKFLPAGALCVEENRQSMEALGRKYLMDCEESCRVLHFSSTKEKEKPWNPVYIMPGYRKWWEYAKESPYYEEYFERQWEGVQKRVEKEEKLNKNITIKNILQTILIVYTVFLTGIGIVLKQPFTWFASIATALVLAAGITILGRRLSIWIGKGRGV